MKKLYILFLIPMMASCNNNEGQPDAWGNFESTEIIISSETSGKILSCPSTEGDLIAKNNIAAIIDTTMFILQSNELNANREGIKSKLRSIDAQNRIIEQQIKNLEVNITRVKNMIEGNASTKKQLDDLTGQVDVLKKQIDANNTQKASVKSEMGVIDSKKALIDEQLSRCYVKFPSAGTILEKYAEAGEITAPGKPLFKIADQSLMKLKVFVSGAQLSEVVLGKECTVRIDVGKKEYKTFRGKIATISNKAEFTPKIIQTHEERVDLVYAVTIEIVNDGSVKSGMPGEAIFDITE